VWTVAAVVGVFLELIGLCLALKGVADTYGEIFLERNLFKDLRADVGRWWQTMVLRRPINQHVIVRGAASGSMTFSGEAVGVARYTRPGGDASIDDVLDYIDASVQSLRRHDEANRTFTKDQVKRLEQRMGERVDAVAGRLSSVDRELRQVRTAVVGPDGAGLRTAVLGLGITMVGVVVSSIAGLAISQ
jgi:hypothetical protein